MKIVIQRVSEASVSIGGAVHGRIGAGMLVLLGIGVEDTEEDAVWLSQKLLGLRIFPDENGMMNCSLTDTKGALLLVSQFTLMASCKKGNRPSFIRAAAPDIALPLYRFFIQQMAQLEDRLQTGVFGADMKVNLCNDGPVTIIMDSKNRE
jgi:D-tyrosyl-tRNA(Tyr) deacylase